VIFVFRLVVGGVFIWAGITKIFDPLGFAQDIADYKAFPRWLSFFSALFLPWVEVFCGICLISGIFPKASALLLSVLLVSFLVLIAVTIGRGIDIDCGCFGGWSQKVDFPLVFSDALLLFFSLNIFLFKDRR